MILIAIMTVVCLPERGKGDDGKPEHQNMSTTGVKKDFMDPGVKRQI